MTVHNATYLGTWTASTTNEADVCINSTDITLAPSEGHFLIWPPLSSTVIRLQVLNSMWGMSLAVLACPRQC